MQGGYGVNFKLNCTDGWALPLSLYDQGRYVTGKRDSLGVGIKITATRTPHKVQREKPRVVVPSGTGVLYFVVVARLTLPKQKKLSVGVAAHMRTCFASLDRHSTRGAQPL